MPLRHTKAIVLRTYRVGEADKIVVFFTRELGKVRGIARGARRARSQFGASLEIGTEVGLTFFEKENQELVRVNRCDIVSSCFRSVEEPIRACTLAYLTDLTDAFAPEREPNVKLYRLLRAALSALVLDVEPEPITRYFEAWLLRLGGSYPRRRTCTACGAKLDERGARYIVEEYRLVCRGCSERGVVLSRETVVYLQRMWREPPESLGPPREDWVLRELDGLHQRLISRELDKELSSYQILQDVGRRESEK
jgi:DNA repair protein RecO (recombination protein O)